MTKLLSALTIVLSLVAQQATAAFLVPDSSTAPFEDWTRGDADSVYAEWDSYSVAFGARGNSPDVGSFPSSGTPSGGAATVTGLESTAFVAGSGNIYSFSSSTKFEVDMSDYGHGAGYNTRIAAQIGVQGNPLDDSSLLLTYNDGSGNVTAAPNYIENRGVNGPQTEWIAVWDIAGYNPSSTLIYFEASASSMSLDTLAVDSFTQTGAFSPLPANVPEPAGLALIGITVCGLLTGRNRPTDRNASRA